LSVRKPFVGKCNTASWRQSETTASKISSAQGPWSATLYQRYVGSYKDEKPLGVIPPGFDYYVNPYYTFNLLVTYTGIKNTSITAGVKNVFDRDPPFSAHNVDDVAGTGWDARVGDPRGRSLFVSATYKFK